MTGVDEVDLARAQEYALLAALLSRAPDAAFLQRLATLRGDLTPLGVAHVGLADAAASADANKVEREFFNLFIGIGRGELMPYGSYYIAGFLHERPLARLREDLAALGIERAEGKYESEDHAPFCARSCPAWPADNSRRPRAPTANYSKSIWRPGSAASSPTWSVPRLRTSTGVSVRSAGSSSKLNRRLSRCLNERASNATLRLQGELAMKTKPEANLARRNFLRALGAGAGVAVAPAALVTEAKADSESDNDKRKARYKADSAEVKTFYRVNRYPS